MKRIVYAVAVWVLACTLGAAATENKGAEQITLDGGSRGGVIFPHRRHQNTLKDCKICHDVFPQEQGAIMKLKEAGKLTPKEIMNKHCIKCHKAEKQAGQQAGPVICSKCHHKG